jgi:hypothetical protein
VCVRWLNVDGHKSHVGKERACGLVIPDRPSTHQVCEEQEGEEQRVQATVEQSRGVYVKGWHTVEQWQQAGIARAGVHGPRFGMKARVVWGGCGQRGARLRPGNWILMQWQRRQTRLRALRRWSSGKHVSVRQR